MAQCYVVATFWQFQTKCSNLVFSTPIYRIPKITSSTVGLVVRSSRNGGLLILVKELGF